MDREHLKSTGTKVVGYDHERGCVVRRTVYAGSNGREYVVVGKYSTGNRAACVPKDWFCKHVLNDEYVTR